MREISLHILDIVQNSLAAQAANIAIIIDESYDKDEFCLKIEDDGCGMSEEKVKRALDPFYTTRKTRKVGLGLSMLQANAQGCNGDLSIFSKEGQGTVVKAIFQHSHIDRPPLGDMVSTMVALISGSPHVNFLYKHSCNDKKFIFQTKEMKDILQETPLSHPQVLVWIKDCLREKEKSLK